MHELKSARLVQVLCHSFYKREKEEILHIDQCHLTQFTQDWFVCWLDSNSSEKWPGANSSLTRYLVFMISEIVLLSIHFAK